MPMSSTRSLLLLWCTWHANCRSQFPAASCFHGLKCFLHTGTSVRLFHFAVAALIALVCASFAVSDA